MSSLNFASGVPRRKFKDFGSGSSENVRTADAWTMLRKVQDGLRSQPPGDLAGGATRTYDVLAQRTTALSPAFSYQRLIMTKRLSSLSNRAAL